MPSSLARIILLAWNRFPKILIAPNQSLFLKHSNNIVPTLIFLPCTFDNLLKRPVNKPIGQKTKLPLTMMRVHYMIKPDQNLPKVRFEEG